MDSAPDDEPDVVLEVPQLRVEEISVARLDNVAQIIDRALTTIDNDPEIVERLVEQVGAAASQAVGEAGAVTGGALEDVGQAAGTLADDAGRSVENVAEGLSGKPRSRQPRRSTDARAARFRRQGERNGDEADAPRR